jgi:hypothetical protein
VTREFSVIPSCSSAQLARPPMTDIKNLISNISFSLISRLHDEVVKAKTDLEIKRKEEVKPLTKTQAAKNVIAEIEKSALKRLTDGLHVDDAKAICEHLEIKFEVCVAYFSLFFLTSNFY